MDQQSLSNTQPFLSNQHHYDFQSSKVRNYKNRNIESDGFHRWAAGNMYRTSYVSAYNDKPVQPKSLAMPKYQGYIPYVVPQGIHAKGYTSITKQCFANDLFGKNKSGLSTTGHNFKYESVLDPSLFASSSKYGKSAIQKAHPAWSVDRMVSSTRDFFRDPNKVNNPTFKQTQKFLQTQKKLTRTSGFSQNHDPYDGTGYKPEEVLNGRRDVTQYRNHFNDFKTFHRNSTIHRTRTLPKRVTNIKAD